MTSLDDIWSDDLLNRRTDAELLSGYIEDLARQPTSRHDAHTYTIAVEAPYGYGKTFFLKRLERHLSLNHPVAYVDAWSDDLADEPLTAIAATLRIALQPMFKQSTAVPALWDRVSRSASTLAVIAAKGMIQKAASALITSHATDLILDTLSTDPGGTFIRSADDVGRIAEDAVGAGVDALASPSGTSLMDKRILEFNEGKRAVQTLKRSLSELVSSLPTDSLHPPIVIIIDELDRCRPTYSVKLIEEVKHLFDVPGIVFVLGVNSDQLGRSLSAAYGPLFDGSAYLRRFVSRTYHLANAELLPLVTLLLQEKNISDNRIRLLPMQLESHNIESSMAPIIAEYIMLYDISARDVFQFIDILRTSLALSAPAVLIGEYILPLIASMIKGAPPGVLSKPTSRRAEPLFIHHDRFGKRQEVRCLQLASDIANASAKSRRELNKIDNNSEPSIGTSLVIEATMGQDHGPSRLSVPANYGRLLSAVGRFS